MPDVTTILRALRVELIAAGIVRHPSTPDATGTIAPLILEPADGAPAPGDREAPEDDPGLIITATLSGDLGEAEVDSYRRRSVVDVRYRSRGTKGLARARAVDDAIADRLVNRPDLGLGWVMAAGSPTPLYVLSTSLYAGLGRIQASQAHGYDEVAKYLVETAR